MKHYLELVPLSARAHKRQSRMTRLCIILAVFLVTAIFGMADMEIRSQKLQVIQSDGAWHANYRDITEQQAALLASRPEVGTFSRYGVLNYRLDENYTVDGRQVCICGFDRDFAALMPAAELTEGDFPAEGEAVLTEGSMELLSLKIGDSVTLSLPDGTQQVLRVSGMSADSANLMKSDALGVYVSTETLLSIAPGEPLVYFVMLSSQSHISGNLQRISDELGFTDEQVQENIKLLGIMGQSSDSYMMKLYGTAGVLTVLVTVAGVLMIASSLNSNVAGRTEFFGLLRCLGAAPGQVRRFVNLEALSWCVTAIPTGIGCAVLVVWLLCAMLKWLSPGYFAAMPVFGVSLLSIGAGLVIGTATVLLAAAKPAKLASRVSPLTAASGNAGTVSQARHAARAGLLPVEAALGIHHATGSRKNFLLMAGSFALSIILFLAFTTAIDFMYHAIRPLKPYTPDLSVYSSDSSRSIDGSLIGTLSAKSGVKRAYGRMFAYEIPAVSGEKSLSVDLVSYEARQFKWAEDSLVQGELEDVINGGGVLAVTTASGGLSAGDTVTADFGTGERTVTVAGLLSDCPFVPDEGITLLICSEDSFREYAGEGGYTIIDMQLNAKATDADVAAIRELSSGLSFSDRRLNNQEVRGAFYSFSLFLYGFLFIIALISAFSIVNSIALSVSARTQQYGAMRAIGMSVEQLRRMVLFEAGTYAVAGIVLGTALGLPMNRMLFEMLVTSRWGDAWSFPAGAYLIIVAAVALSSFLSVLRPVERIRSRSIVDTIRAE